MNPTLAALPPKEPNVRATTLSLAVLLLLLAPVYAGPDSPASLGRSTTSSTFRASFESTTILSGAYVSATETWVEKLLGRDGQTGFSWPRASWSRFAYLADGSDDIGSIIETRIDDVTGHDGQPTRALYQAVLRDNQSTVGHSRNMYSVRNGPTDVFAQGTVRYWLKLQPDLKEVLPAGSWRQVFELREEGDLYRKAVIILPDATTGKLYWRVHGDVGPTWTPDWQVNNRTVPVPLGEWMLFEVYWKEGSGSHGRMVVRINCQTVADHVGRTRYQGPLDAVHLFKVYASPESLALGPSYQWIDDVEVSTTLAGATCP